MVVVNSKYVKEVLPIQSKAIFILRKFCEKSRIFLISVNFSRSLATSM